jgi:hypothetical protein
MQPLNHPPSTQGHLRRLNRGLKRWAAARAALVLLMAAALGLQWLLLQGLAWSLMMARFSVQDDLGVALIKTLDGDHPCPLCIAAQRGNQQQQEDEDSNPSAPQSKCSKQEATAANPLPSPRLCCLGQLASIPHARARQRPWPPPHAPPRGSTQPEGTAATA